MSLVLKKNEIDELFISRGINVSDTYVVGQKKNSILSGLLKLLISNLWYAIDGAAIRIIAVTEHDLVIVNPNFQLKGEYKDLPDKYIQVIPFNMLEDLHVSSDGKNGCISWKYNNKSSVWNIPLYNPGVWNFNPDHFAKIENIIRKTKNEN